MGQISVEQCGIEGLLVITPTVHGDERGYFIYQGVGTNDDLKAQSVDMAEEMLSRSNVFTPDHYVFYQKDGGQHDYYSAMEFVYNALPLFFGREP